MGRFLLGILTGTLVSGAILSALSLALPRPLHERVAVTATPAVPGPGAPDARVTAVPDAPVRQQPPVRETMPAVPAAPPDGGIAAPSPARPVAAPAAPSADVPPTEQMRPPRSLPDPEAAAAPAAAQAVPEPLPAQQPPPEQQAPSDRPPVAADAIGMPPVAPPPPEAADDDPARAGLRREPGWKAQIVPDQTDTLRDLTGEAVLPPAQPDLAGPEATLALPLTPEDDVRAMRPSPAQVPDPAVPTGAPTRGPVIGDSGGAEDAMPGGADTPQPPAALPVADDLLTTPDRPGGIAPAAGQEGSGF